MKSSNDLIGVFVFLINFIIILLYLISLCIIYVLVNNSIPIPKFNKKYGIYK